MRILKLRWLAVALLASALAGCVTAENTLTKADVATFKLADVRVSVAPDAKIVWYEPLQAYAATKKIPDEQYADFIKTDDAKAHVERPHLRQGQRRDGEADGRRTHRRAAGPHRSRRDAIHRPDRPRSGWSLAARTS